MARRNRNIRSGLRRYNVVVIRARSLVLVLLSLGVVGCATSSAVPRPFPGASLPPRSGPASDPVAATPLPLPPTGAAAGAPALPIAAPVVATARAYRGTPYRNGGSDPNGFDCSGFVQWVFAQNGQRMPREVRDQFSVGQEIGLDAVQPGDLVFFETVSRGASHVGIALGNGEFVHAPSSRGVVRVERYGLDYWAKRYVGARRVVMPAPAVN